MTSVESSSRATRRNKSLKYHHHLAEPNFRTARVFGSSQSMQNQQQQPQPIVKSTPSVVDGVRAALYAH